MKTIFVLLAAVAGMFALSVQAETPASQMKAFEKECMGYALEENVPEEDLQGYMAQCVQDLAAAQTEDDEQTQESADQE